MKTESISCNNCGAALQVPETANFVTCSHCSSRLAIRRNESVVFTEKLDEIGDRQEEMLERLDRIERQNRVAQIDRSWEREQQRYMIKDKHGHAHLPSNAGVVMSFVVAGFGVVWTIIAGSMSPMMGLFGVVFIVIAIVGGVTTMQKSKDFRRAQRNYYRRRREASSQGANDGRSFEDRLNQFE